jgi:glycosyltransferase involved in cell wall biosynthesis
VQDFEPYFDSVGTSYFTAMNTYRQDLYAITTGRWLGEVLEEDFGMIARPIDFWMDRRYYYPRQLPPGTQKKRTVVFFARPEMPRRCFPLGIAALGLLHRKMPDVEIVFFGTKRLGKTPIDFPHKLLGLTSLDELGNQYRTADLGIAFSTTNPSLVNFEMMACGLPVVDLDVLDSRRRHDGALDERRRPHSYPALLADPSPEALAEAMAALLDSPARLAEMSRKSIEFTSAMPSAEESIRQFCDHVEEGVYGQRADELSRL